MSLFFSKIGEKISKLPQIRVSRLVQAQVNELVVKHLGYTNLNQVRDRLDGQSFLDKNSLRIYAKVAVLEHLKIPFNIADLNLIEEDENVVFHNNKEFQIKVVPFGELPVFAGLNFPNDVIIVYQKDTLVFTLLGVLNQELLMDVKNYRKVQEGFQFINIDLAIRL